jgi:Family of unknown function (DUF6069)
MHTTTATLPANILRTRLVCLVSALAGVTAAAATELYGVVARSAGIPMAAGSIGATTAEPITVGMFAMGTLICTFWGTVLAVILARYATRPARAYVRTTVALTAVSLAGPIGAGDTAASTKLTLALAHLLAAAIVIPIVTRRLSHASGMATQWRRTRPTVLRVRTRPRRLMGRGPGPRLRLPRSTEFGLTTVRHVRRSGPVTRHAPAASSRATCPSVSETSRAPPPPRTAPGSAARSEEPCR